MATAIQQSTASQSHPMPVSEISHGSMVDSSIFNCSMSVDNAKYSIKEDVLPWLMFVLTNKSDTNAYYVLKWHTPLEGFRGNFLRVYCGNEELPYEGIMEKRGNPDSSSYDLLFPGSSVSASVYLGEAYDLSKPGVYRVELNTALADVIEDKGGEFEPHEISKFQGLNIKCEPIIFEIFA